MSKPVDQLDFWADRLRTAVSLHYSVYVANEPLWNNINTHHRRIFDKIIPKDAKVLDAGCAYGRWSTHFENYVGVDFSPDFIKLAKEKFPEKIFLVANLKALPFSDKEFDWAFCVSIKTMVVNNLGEEEWDMMESELKRVAKKVLILEYENPEPFEVLRG